MDQRIINLYDSFTHGGINRRDFLESFKSTVTNARIGTEGKGANQKTSDNRTNGAMFTNHLDGVPINADKETVGGIGVSGAPGGDKDEACADAGIAKIDDRLK